MCIFCLRSRDDTCVLHQSCQQYSPLLFRHFRWSVIYTPDGRQSSSAPVYIQRGITEKYFMKRFTACKWHFCIRAGGNIFINMTPAYLFSNHLGLLVNLLPIGHITQEVMALCSRERDLFSCFFEALFCSAPQDHLAKNKKNVWRVRNK